MKRTAIRLGWADWRHRLMLVGLWAFYRWINLCGLRRTNFEEHEDLSAEIAPAVELALSHNMKVQVYNFLHPDGRVVTVMLAKVCDAGHPPTGGGHV